jgi:hypothetical protein
MENKIEISEKYLNDALDTASVKLVGETMSNFESISNLAELKKVVKNTIYQNFRDLKAQIMAFNSGVKFISPKTAEK